LTVQARNSWGSDRERAGTPAEAFSPFTGRRWRCPNPADG
jgi:hypothetical protein